MTAPHGQFIVIEGLDGAGTTTQSAKLVAAFERAGIPVIGTREPTQGPVGRLIRAALTGEPGAVSMPTLPWMFAADRSDHLHRLVLPQLDTGTTVISDRYLHSSLAYQSAFGPLDVVWSLNAHFPAPAITFFLDVPVQTCLDRIAARGEPTELFEKRERLEAIHRQYEVILGKLATRGDRIVRVDGTDTVEAIHATIAEVALG